MHSPHRTCYIRRIFSFTCIHTSIHDYTIWDIYTTKHGFNWTLPYTIFPLQKHKSEQNASARMNEWIPLFYTTKQNKKNVCTNKHFRIPACIYTQMRGEPFRYFTYKMGTMNITLYVYLSMFIPYCPCVYIFKYQHFSKTHTSPHKNHRLSRNTH